MRSISDYEKSKQRYNLYQGVRFQVIPVSPASASTPLQMICFFDQTLNRIVSGGTEDVDWQFRGAIHELRERDQFHGDFLETLELQPQGRIPAERLLLIGLGNPEDLSTERLEKLGRLTICEAMKAKVDSFAFAPDIRSTGVIGFPARDVSIAVTNGMKSALNALQDLQEAGLLSMRALKEVILLSGAQHVNDSQSGLSEAIQGTRSEAA